MSQSDPRSQPDDPRTGEEIARVPHEPWLPIETMLVLGSLALGVLLLGLLLWASGTFFPVP
jgi:hypothetical protein